MSRVYNEEMQEFIHSTLHSSELYTLSGAAVESRTNFLRSSEFRAYRKTQQS
jgi:hypothetical protein